MASSNSSSPAKSFTPKNLDSPDFITSPQSIDNELPRTATIQHIVDRKTQVDRVTRDDVLLDAVTECHLAEESVQRAAVRDLIAGYIFRIAEHPEWAAPSVAKSGDGTLQLLFNNPVSEEMFTEMPSLAAWRRDLVPGAIALYPLQHPEIKVLPNGVAIDEKSRLMFAHSLDAIGIRSRAQVMATIAERYVDREGQTYWTSLACGAAVPVLNAITSISPVRANIQLTLVDFDAAALSFARSLAHSKNLVENETFFVLQRNLLRGMIASDHLVYELGPESMHLVDALGIFEYFSEEQSVRFLRNSYRLLRPGGAFVAANMLDSHPEIDFNQRIIGWPNLYPRSIQDLERIIVRAGVSLSNVSFTLPDDGIYAVMEVRR